MKALLFILVLAPGLAMADLASDVVQSVNGMRNATQLKQYTEQATETRGDIVSVPVTGGACGIFANNDLKVVSLTGPFGNYTLHLVNGAKNSTVSISTDGKNVKIKERTADYQELILEIQKVAADSNAIQQVRLTENRIVLVDPITFFGSMTGREFVRTVTCLGN